jgi:ribosomal protein L11 methyltransferase
MSESWKASCEVTQAEAKAALLAQEETLDWDATIVVSACEIAPDRPDDWAFEAWFPRKPQTADKEALLALFDGVMLKGVTKGKPPQLSIEKLPETDWVVESQKGVPPIKAGRFCVHTPDHAPDPEAVNFVIPASLAFGTGQHETTAGCLAMLDEMKRAGEISRNHADIGTGTGLLGFAAMHLWPNALAIASDIDPICKGVIEENARLNSIALGQERGAMQVVIADGMDHPALIERAPFDLLIANILAGPLINLAPAFASAVEPGGNVVLAGLLETQESSVRKAYSRENFRLAKRLVNGDWSILWLRKRG